MRVALYRLAIAVSAFWFFTGCLPYSSMPSIPDDTVAEKPPSSWEDKAGGPAPPTMGGMTDHLQPPVDVVKNESANQLNPQEAFRPPRPNHYYNFLASQLYLKAGDIDRAIQYIKRSIAGDPESSFLIRELAVLYLRQNDKSGALRVMERQLEKDPDDIDTLVLYGKIQQSLDRTSEAIDIYERVLGIDAKQEEVYLFLGGLYMENNDYDNAFRIYTRLIALFPRSYVGHFFLGKIHADKGDLTAAEDAFRKTLEIEPELEEPRMELLKLFESRNDTAGVVRMYQQILANNPLNFRAAMELGYFYHLSDDPDKAENIFMELGRRSLTDPDVVRKAVNRYLDTKEFEAAVVIFEGMLKAVPQSSGLHYIAGVAYDGLKNADMTLKHLQMVSPDSRFYKSAVVHIAYLLQKQGKSNDAIHNLKTAIGIIPRDPDIYLHLGNLYEDAKAYKDAVDAFKQGLEISPENINLRFRLGAVYDQWGLKKESIEEMKAVIRLDPKHANALNYLGYTYADLGTNLDEAERLIKEALKYEPDSGYITDSLGWVYFKKGLFYQALETLEKAVALVPNDPTVLEHLGDVYHKINNIDKALEFYNKSLKKLEEENMDQTDIIKKIRQLTGDGS